MSETPKFNSTQEVTSVDAPDIDEMLNEAHEGDRELYANEAKEALSAHLHEDWREGIRAGFEADGKDPDTPRLRTSKDKTGEMDETWYQEKEAAGVVFERDANGDRLVNTNVPYEELSPSWQQANVGAAEFVVDSVVASIDSGADVTSDDYIESVASNIHDKWMEDNSWQKDSTPELFVPYEELSETEKAKDRNQVLLALEKLLT